MAKKIFILSCFIVVFLFFVGIGLLGWYMGKAMPVLGRVVTVPFLEKPGPSVLADMKANMGRLQTATYDLDIVLAPVPEQPVKSVKINATYDGKIGQTLLGQLFVGASVDINNLSYLASANFRFSENKGYVQIADVPALSFISMAAVKDHWFYFLPDDVSSPSGGTWRTVGQSVNSPALVTGYERKPDEMIAGQAMYRFDLQLSPQAWSQVIDASAAAMWPGSADKKITDFMNGQQATDASIWIGKHDRLLYQMNIGSHGQHADLSAHMAVSGFNREIAIEQPGDAEPVSLLPQTVFSGTNFLDWPLFGYQVGLDLSRQTSDADKDGLYEMWETAFGTDPDNPDSDHDGYSDGAEVRGGYNPAGAGKLMSGW